MKRRNVVRVAIAYAIVSWLLIEIASTVFPMLMLPEWTATFVAVLLILGFPVALIFAWAYELTPEGLKKEKDVDRSESATRLTDRKLDFVIIGVLAVTVAYFIGEKLFWSDVTVSESQSESASVTTAEITRSIAVLPFVNMSGDAEQEYFSDGITEEILNALAGIRELAVTSRTSAFAFKGKSISIPAIAKELGVAHVLEGSVRKSGERLRITAQLIDVASDRHLWSESYDRELTDVFAVQEEISANIAAALKVSLLGETVATPAPPAAVPEAYDLYLRGLQQVSLQTFAANAQAEKYFQEAIDIDPKFVRAYAALGWTWFNQSNSGSVPRDVNLPKIRQLLERGLKLDADNAGLIGISGQLALWDGNLEQARVHFGRAMTLDPPYFGIWYSYSDTLWFLGRLSEAVKVRTDWLQSDPLNPNAHGMMAFTHYFLGDADATFAAASRLREIAPDNPYGLFINGLIRIVDLGDLANGILAFEESLKIDPDDHEVIILVGLLCYSIGEIESAEAFIDKGRQLAPENTMVNAARAYGLALRGDLTAAKQISLDALAEHRQFERWFGGYITLRFAVDELIDRGEPMQAVEMILQAEPKWVAFRDQGPSDALHLSTNPGRYGVGPFLIDYFADFARALRAAGDETGAGNVLAHMQTNLNWRHEHSLLDFESRDAELFALQGRLDDAMDALERAEKNGSMYLLWQYRLIHNRIFDEIRDHPRFEALVERVEAEMQRQRNEYVSKRPPAYQIPL
jgi:TolB-like protein